ncbi:glycosyl hydrolase [Pseudomonas sp. MWU16-30317]|uniref:glycosyl hydrolase n=1 Tax=Pseudomonas sp. MWU16-30317 TaxID=2878095 RepID=UPI001CFA82CA
MHWPEVSDAYFQQDAELSTANGGRYRVLYLGGSSQHMTLATLEKVRDLVAQGATQVGARPLSSPSEADDARRFSALADQLWPPAGSATQAPDRVLTGMNPEQALAHLGIQPDLRLHHATVGADLRFQHRRLKDGSEVYFIANLGDHAERLDAQFRVKALKPELWDADCGEAHAVAFGADTNTSRLNLELRPGDTQFVIFRNTAKATEPATRLSERQALSGPWQLGYPTATEHNHVETLAQLMDCAQSPDPALRYFSGTATYTLRFNSLQTCGTHCYLDLGEVRDLAQVTLNQRSLGTLWKPPYRVEVGKVLRKGLNTLQVRVITPWVNRLIGDAQPGATPVLFTTGPTYTADAPLRRSGLLGPVNIEHYRTDQ